MGIFSGLALASRAAKLDAAGRGALAFPTRELLSPWADNSSLTKILAEELYPILQGTADPVDRAMALTVPAIVKARAILHSLIASRPLIALDSNGPKVDQPTWLYRSDTGVAPQMRVADILDDLIFDEASLLLVQRGAKQQDQAFAPIVDAMHWPRNLWMIRDGQVVINDEPVAPDDYVLIYGPGPGLLSQAAETIRASRDMQAAWAQRVRTPVPPIVLKQLEDNGMTQEEAQAYVDAVSAARRKSGVMYVPYGMDAEMTNPGDDSGLFIEGRNALRLDIANFFNLPAALLDGSTATASLTYSTQEGRRNEVFDYGIAYWIAPIENALSLDNVCPRGQRIRFDFTDLNAAAPSPTGPATED